MPTIVIDVLFLLLLKCGHGAGPSQLRLGMVALPWWLSLLYCCWRQQPVSHFLGTSWHQTRLHECLQQKQQKQQLSSRSRVCHFTSKPVLRGGPELVACIHLQAFRASCWVAILHGALLLHKAFWWGLVWRVCGRRRCLFVGWEHCM